jgi:glutamate-1-semialdehyde aminotransferase
MTNSVLGGALKPRSSNERQFINPTGWQLYESAKRIIPGGTQLLSKRPEMFLPQGWPAYYSKAQGCTVWDLDNRPYLDMTTTGIGACLLGYADADVNAAAKQAIDRGSMTTLNPPDEIELAELLCAIHPWAHMARFTRTGGEAMAVAVRIARASTGRSHIAFCGYHGWCDWYLAANLAADSALDGHLLPGLAPSGVPRELAGTASGFRYNHAEDLEAIAGRVEGGLAAIVMEPMRFGEPSNDFLHRIRELADRTGAVLIFDEITAGWRHCYGGLHLKLGVTPDIAVFAKSLSNGFPMAAILGTSAAMQAAQQSFISSTFWTESIGPAAAVATLKKMKSIDVSAKASRAGAVAQNAWRELAEKHELNIAISGWPALTSFTMDYGEQSGALKTLLTQQMLDRGFLANTTFYPTAAHDQSVMNQYIVALDEVFGELRQAIVAGDVLSQLRGGPAHSGFARLT